LPGAFETVGNVFSSAANAIVAPLKDTFGSVLSIFNPLANVVNGISSGIATVLTPILGDAIATSIGTNLIGLAVNLGASFAFEGMKLDPTLSYMGSALLSGSFMGMADIGSSLGLISGAFKTGVIAGMEVLGQAVDLNPNITHLAAMTAGSLTAGYITTPEGETFSYTKIMDSIKYNVLAEAAYIGTHEIGRLLGVDPKVSYLAGIGIRSSLRVGFSSGGNPLDMFGAAIQGLLRGATSIGLQWVAQELEINPLLSALSSNVLAGAIEGFLEDKNPIRGAFDSSFKAGMGFLTLGGLSRFI